MESNILQEVDDCKDIGTSEGIVAEFIDSDMDILWKTRSYHIVLARVYAADGQYKKALRQIPQFMRGIGKNIELWKMPSIQALRERFAWEYILSGKALLDVAAFMFDSAASLLSFGAEGNYQK